MATRKRWVGLSIFDRKKNAKDAGEGRVGAADFTAPRFGTPNPAKYERERGNPYFEARKEYEDRYGSVTKAAAKWRQISFAMIFLCLAFGVAMIYQSMQNKIVPYIVEVDRHGYAVTIKSAQEGSVADERVVIATLGRIMMDLRTVVSDTRAQKKLIDNVYSCIARDSAAEVTISSFYREHNPYELVKAKKQTREVNIKSIAPFQAGDGKGTSWLVLWTEALVDGGRVVQSQEYRAIVQIAISPVRDLSDVLKNPLGIYITEINIARDIA